MRQESDPGGVREGVKELRADICSISLSGAAGGELKPCVKLYLLCRTGRGCLRAAMHRVR